MVRTPGFHKNGMKKGAWTEEEDNKLRVYVQAVQKYGHWNWRELPKYAGLARCGKSCRLRWLNYLKPGVRRGNYTKEEEDLIIKLHEELGTRWSAIARRLPGRTDNDIKNHWHTHLKKRVNPNTKNCKAIDPLREASKSEGNDKEQPIATFQLEASQKKVLATEIVTDASHLQTLESFPFSPEQSLNQFLCFNHDYHETLEFMVDAQSQQALQSFGASPEEISYLTKATDYAPLNCLNSEAEDNMTSLISSEASLGKSHEAAQSQQTIQSFDASLAQCFNEIYSSSKNDYALLSCIDWAAEDSWALQESYIEPPEDFWTATTHLIQPKY